MDPRTQRHAEECADIPMVAAGEPQVVMTCPMENISNEKTCVR